MCGVLGALLLAPAFATAQSSATPQGLREQTADQQVLQVLNRLAFGPRPGDVLKVRTMGVDAWIDQQLHPERINDDAMDQMLSRYPLLEEDQSALASQFAQAQRESRLVKRDTAAGKPGDTAEMQALKDDVADHGSWRAFAGAQGRSSLTNTTGW